MRSQISKSWIYSLVLLGSVAWAGFALTDSSSKVSIVEVLPFSSVPLPAENLENAAKKSRHC